jgi:hypothetical protein
MYWRKIMTEREEFELVAKAAGYTDEQQMFWNPKTDDGAAGRLAVDLEIDVGILRHCIVATAFEKRKYIEAIEVFADHQDKSAAVRAAVWDVALEVAKRREQIMEEQMREQREEEQRREAQYIEVTRAMAKDAGFPEMAGQIIKW